MAKHIFKGEGAPSFTPPQIGHHYVDTLNGDQYLSKGISSPSDWVLLTPSIDDKVKVSAADTTNGYLSDKIQAGAGINVSIGNPGSDEDVVIASTITQYTNEMAQDAIAAALVDTASIDFTYNDVGNQISASVLPAGVDHDSLQNFVANEHVDHTAVTISAGTGLTGGGDISANRTISMPAVGTAGTYGSATQVPVITTDTQGRVSSAVDTPISIPSTQVSDFTEAAQDAVGAALTDTASVDLAYNDAGNQISASVIPGGVDHNSLANLTTGDPHTQYVKGPASATDNAIARYDATTGKLVQNSSATVDDNGGIIASDLIRPGNTSDTTDGNIRYTGSEMQARQGGVWVPLGQVPQSVSATSALSTTSATFSLIDSMTFTPAAGTYLVMFSCSAGITNDSNGDITIYVGGAEQTHCRRNLNVTVSGASTGTLGGSVNIITMVTVNGAEDIEAFYRENGGGTMSITNRELIIIPVSR